MWGLADVVIGGDTFVGPLLGAVEAQQDAPGRCSRDSRAL